MKPLYSSAYPASHLLNPAKRYVPAAKTDVRATFERVSKASAEAAPKSIEMKPRNR